MTQLRDEIKQILIEQLTAENEHIEFIDYLTTRICDASLTWYLPHIAEAVAKALNAFMKED